MDLALGKVFSEQKLLELISGYVLDVDHLSLKMLRCNTWKNVFLIFLPLFTDVPLINM